MTRIDSDRLGSTRIYSDRLGLGSTRIGEPHVLPRSARLRSRAVNRRPGTGRGTGVPGNKRGRARRSIRVQHPSHQSGASTRARPPQVVIRVQHPSHHPPSALPRTRPGRLSAGLPHLKRQVAIDSDSNSELAAVTRFVFNQRHWGRGDRDAWPLGAGRVGRGARGRWPGPGPRRASTAARRRRGRAARYGRDAMAKRRCQTPSSCAAAAPSRSRAAGSTGRGCARGDGGAESSKVRRHAGAARSSHAAQAMLTGWRDPFRS